MKTPEAINLKQFILGVVVFLLGSLEYLLNRSTDSTCLGRIVNTFRECASGIDLFGMFGGIIPAFAHPFSFVLITMAIFPGSGRKTKGLICIFWLFVELFFEIGQGFGRKIAGYIPEFFARIYILDNLKSYFINGTYDHLDVMAICLGIAAAYVTGQLTSSSRYSFS